MWHEARKQERKIRGMLVDYRKRAERRQDFYEKIKADPTQFMQIHSRKCKIHLDPAVAAAGDSPAIMMPWQGMQDNMIDRFDGRAYLDLDKIPVAPKAQKDESAELSSEERLCNYERYRILAQNDFLTISEEKYLQQLHLEEQFGIHAQIEMEKPKKKSGTGAAIGYTYEDSADTIPVAQFSATIAQVSSASGGAQVASGQQDEDSDSDLDVDVAIDISKIDTAQAHELNACGRHYGMKSNDFYSFLTRDADEADALKLAREEEQEKIMLSGRKSRRERRAQRERRFAGRTISPPSYAAKEDQTGMAGDDDRADSAESRSPSPENSGKITYITSFGGEDELQPHSKISINFGKNASSSASGSQPSTVGGPSATYADKVRENLEKLKKLNNSIRSPTSSSPKKPLAYQRRRSYSRSRSRSFDRRAPIRRRRSRSRSRRRRSRSRSRSRNRSSRYTRSRSRSRSPRRSRSRRHYHSSSSTTSSSSRSPPRRRYRSPSSSSSSTSPASSSSRSSYRSKTPSPVHSNRLDTDMRAPNVKRESNVEIPKHKPPGVVHASVLPDVKVKPEPSPPAAINAIVMEEPVVPIRRYYGRKRDDQSSSDDENDEQDGTEDPDDTTSTDRPAKSSHQPVAVLQSQAGQSSAPSAPSAHHSPKSSSPFSSKFGKQPTTSTTVDTKTGSKSQHDTTTSSSSNPRDRLKRKMQILLNKQYKADKLAEIEKSERQVQMQQEREEEMRELALRLRRRQRELRHKYGTPTSSHSEDENERRSDDEQQTRSTAVVKQSRPVSSFKNGSSSVVAAASFTPREHSPRHQQQRSRTRSRSPQHSSGHQPSRSSYRSQRGRPSRFSDDRPYRNERSGYSRSPSRDRFDHRRSDNANDMRRNVASRYWESDGYQSSRMQNRRSGSRDRVGRSGADVESGSGRGSHRSRGREGGSNSRKLVDY